MCGTLFHSKELVQKEYVGRDGRLHFELQSVDGDSMNLSHSSWGEMMGRITRADCKQTSSGANAFWAAMS